MDVARHSVLNWASAMVIAHRCFFLKHIVFLYVPLGLPAAKAVRLTFGGCVKCWTTCRVSYHREPTYYIANCNFVRQHIEDPYKENNCI